MLDFYHKNPIYQKRSRNNAKNSNHTMPYLYKSVKRNRFHSLHLSKINQIYPRARPFLAHRQKNSHFSLNFYQKFTKIQFIKKDRGIMQITQTTRCPIFTNHQISETKQIPFSLFVKNQSDIFSNSTLPRKSIKKIHKNSTYQKKNNSFLQIIIQTTRCSIFTNHQISETK